MFFHGTGYIIPEGWPKCKDVVFKTRMVEHPTRTVLQPLDPGQMDTCCETDESFFFTRLAYIAIVAAVTVMAEGYTILENFIQKDGFVLTSLLSTYLIPTVQDVPEKVNSVILEYADPIGPYFIAYIQIRSSLSGLINPWPATLRAAIIGLTASSSNVRTVMCSPPRNRY